MSALDKHLRKHRRLLIEREEAAFREMLTVYKQFERDLKREIAALQKQIAEATAAGKTISPSWLYREQRLKKFLDTVKTQVERFGGTVARITTAEQRLAVSMAVEQANELVRLVMGGDGMPFAATQMFSTRNVEAAIGMMGDGSPIYDYWKKNYAEPVVERLRAQIVNAVGAGMPSKVLAKHLELTVAATRTRALTIARTETHRVRVAAQRQAYEAEGVEQWEWICSHSTRTCAACLALDGRLFPIKEPMPNHVRCRCRMIPYNPRLPNDRRLGSDYFESLSDADKAKIVGEETVEAMDRGEVTLKDLVGWRNHKVFGKSVYRRPLAQALAEAK